VSPHWHAEYADYVEGRLPWLRRVAYLLCQDWHSADDLVQVTATRLFTHWPRVACTGNVDAYVRTILVRTFLSERRSTWFRRVRLPGGLADRAAAAADLDAVLDVRGALAALPPRQRATLILRYYCDLDVEQAAIALGCSAGTVKSQTSKALASLRRVLEPAWGDGTSPASAPTRLGAAAPTRRGT
jgi:RNA polymerase sigma-70 factor (sigma-E family)